MGEPVEHGTPDETPEDHPGHGHGTDPGWVPPGQGGTPPGHEDKPDTPEKPADDAPHPAPHPHAAAAPVEALLGLREFALVMPRRRSAAVTQASLAALRRWMQLHGHDTNGFYSLAEWQSHYAAAMSYTGSPVPAVR